MSVYSFQKKFCIRYSDCDFQDLVKPSSLLSFLQEAACLSADELGFGYADLKPKEMAFIIVNTYFRYLKPIGLGDDVTVETWPLTPRFSIFERDYVIRTNGEEAAVAASRWCLVDLNTFSILMPDALGKTHTQCPYRDDKAVAANWKIPKLIDPKKKFERVVTPSECDHYLHANNTRYADYFFDCYDFSELSRPIETFQIAYSKQAKPGNKIEFYREDAENSGAIDACLNGETITRFKATFKAGRS